MRLNFMGRLAKKCGRLTNKRFPWFLKAQVNHEGKRQASRQGEHHSMGPPVPSEWPRLKNKCPTQICSIICLAKHSPVDQCVGRLQPQRLTNSAPGDARKGPATKSGRPMQKQRTRTRCEDHVRVLLDEDIVFLVDNSGVSRGEGCPTIVRRRPNNRKRPAQAKLAQIGRSPQTRFGIDEIWPKLNRIWADTAAQIPRGKQLRRWSQQGCGPGKHTPTQVVP